MVQIKVNIAMYYSTANNIILVTNLHYVIDYVQQLQPKTAIYLETKL